jgi:uncharacterized protein YchJ
MESKTYYDLLELDKEASNREIKKAYFKQVRKNPPDQAPEKFKKIRAAYEILSDPVAKEEYDNRILLPEWLKNALNLAEECRENGNTSKAIAIYEEILSKYKSVKFIEVELGETYIENNNTQKAIDLFKNLLQKNKNDLVIMNRLVAAYSMRGWINKAIELCEYMIDQKVDAIENIYTNMLEAYLQNEKYKKAQKFAIKLLDYNTDDQSTFLGIICGTELSIIQESENITSRSYKKLRKYCIWFLDHLKENQELIDGVFEYIVNMIFHAYKAEDAIQLTDPLADYINDEERIEAYQYAKENKFVFDEIDMISHDRRISSILVDIIQMTFAKNQSYRDDAFFLDELEYIAAKIELIDNYEYHNREFKVLKSEYNGLYTLIKDFIDDIRFKNNREKTLMKLFKELEKTDTFGLSNYLESDDEFMDFRPYEEPYTNDEVKVGRNDPCPCGSGRKYKKCCINK